jgi:hypothetical protein
MFKMGSPVELIRAISAYTSPLFFFSAFLLFLPDSILTKFGFLNFRNDYRLAIGLVFLLTVSFILSNVVNFFRGKIKDYWCVRAYKNYIISYLKELTPPEKAVLKKFIFNDTQSQNLDIMSGVTKGLEAKKIIVRAANVGSLFGGFAFNIQPLAYEYLKDNKHLLE